ncbi:MAG: hypothetical protein WCW84_13155 [Sulfurimonas sp.]|jgi:hypothetical protein
MEDKNSKIIKYKVALYKNNENYWFAAIKNEEESKEVESRTYFKKWITDWLNVEL